MATKVTAMSAPNLNAPMGRPASMAGTTAICGTV